MTCNRAILSIFLALTSDSFTAFFARTGHRGRCRGAFLSCCICQSNLLHSPGWYIQGNAERKRKKLTNRNHSIQYSIRCNYLIKVRALLINLQDLSKDSLRVCGASVWCWYSNTNMISFREYCNSMLLAIEFNWSLVGMVLILACFIMQFIPLLLVSI